MAPLAVATKVSGVVTTSSPGPIPRAAYAVCSAAVPEVTLTAPGVAGQLREPLLEATHPRPGRQPVTAEHLDDGLDVAVVDRLAAVGEHAQTSVSRSFWKSARVNHSSLLSDV